MLGVYSYNATSADAPLRHVSQAIARKMQSAGEGTVLCKHCGRTTDRGRCDGRPTHEFVVQLSMVERLSNNSPAAITMSEIELASLCQILDAEERSGRAKAALAKIYFYPLLGSEKSAARNIRYKKPEDNWIPAGPFIEEPSESNGPVGSRISKGFEMMRGA
jgi:hypothetical protein